MGRVSIRGWALASIALASLAACRSSDPTTTPGGVGAACHGDLACALGLTCTLVIDGFDLGAVCTRSCLYDDDCPSGSRCGPSGFTDAGEVLTSCLRVCDRTEDVASACGDTSSLYACEYDGLCTVLACDPDLCSSGHCDARTGDCITGGNPAARVDDPCSSDADCRPPRGSCEGGRCVEYDCDRGGEYACAAGETCVASSVDGGTTDTLTYSCARTCTIGVDATGPTSGGACVDGQLCVSDELDPGGLASGSFCGWYNMHTYVTGDPTAHVGDACARNDDCPSPFGYGLCDGGRCALRFCNTTAFAGMPDPCGPALHCVSFVPPGPQTRIREVAAHAGACLQACDAAGGCGSGMICNVGGGYCQPDCRLAPGYCPAPTTCRMDGTCT